MPNAIPAVMHYVVAREPGPPEVLALDLDDSYHFSCDTGS
jgi:hypothetical protein